MREIKKPTTFEEQVQILKSRNLLIENEDNAKHILSSVNYYNITGYGYTFKDNDVYNNISFEKLYRIYLFDKRIKSIILYATEIIEHNLRAKLAYTIAHNHGALGYEDVNNFKEIKEHQILMDKFHKAIRKNSKLEFVKHHKENYGGKFPVWVAVELFTLGMILNCYKNINRTTRKNIAEMFGTGPIQLESWIDCILYLRNMAAHYMRLYRVNIQKTPKRCNKNCPDFIPKNKVYDIIYIMKFLMPDPKEWNSYIIPSLKTIWTEYQPDVMFKDYGFSDNWLQELKIK